MNNQNSDNMEIIQDLTDIRVINPDWVRVDGEKEKWRTKEYYENGNK